MARRIGWLVLGAALILAAGGCALAPPRSARLGDTWRRPADGMVMVYVPGGEFEMGSTGGHADEQPVHAVALDAFYLDRTEVTMAQFRAFARATGHRTTAEREGWAWAWAESTHRWQRTLGADWQHPDGPESSADADYPVVQVSWDDAVAYCRWAGGELPSEAQWEFASRGPEGRVFPWGDVLGGTRFNWCDANCPQDWRDADFDDGYRLMAPVGRYPAGASWCGALDLAGNAWEWVADWYAPYVSERQLNPTGPSSGRVHVVRGGGWANGAARARGANRDAEPPDARNGYLGFRCALVPQDE